MSESTATSVPAVFAVSKRRLKLLGLTLDDVIKAFFGGNALVSVVVLALITIFLFREGFGFFAQNRQNLRIYREAGLEYVDFIRAQSDDHTALTRYLSDLRLRQLNFFLHEKNLPLAEANAALAGFDDFADKFSYAIDTLRAMVSDLADQATEIKTKFIVAGDKNEERRQLLAEEKTAAAAAVKIDEVNFTAELKPLLATRPAYQAVNRELAQKLSASLEAAPKLATPDRKS